MTKTQLERLQVMYEKLSKISAHLEEILHESDMTLKEFSTVQEDPDDPDEYVTVDTLTADIDEIETMVDMVKRDIENLLHNVPK